MCIVREGIVTRTCVRRSCLERGLLGRAVLVGGMLGMGEVEPCLGYVSLDLFDLRRNSLAQQVSD